MGLGVSVGLESSDGVGSARESVPREDMSFEAPDTARRSTAACTLPPPGRNTQMPTITALTAKPLRSSSPNFLCLRVDDGKRRSVRGGVGRRRSADGECSCHTAVRADTEDPADPLGSVPLASVNDGG